MDNSPLGYAYLNRDEQYAYNLLYDAFKKKATTCDISKVKRSVNLVRVLNTVLGDNPNIIYFNKTKIRTVGSLLGKHMSFVGCLSKRQSEECDVRLKKALEDAVWKIDKNAKNDKDILMGISEFLQRNVKYDKEELTTASRGKSKSPMSHNAYGALVNHKAVCDGFSSAYALIAHYFGIRCMIVAGRSSYNKSSLTDHAWNIVEYENSYFHIDSTWDTNTYETINAYSYDYFGLDDDEIALDHEWDISNTPKCNSNKLSYFISNGIYAYSESQIEDIILKQIKLHKNVIRLKVSPRVPFVGEGGKKLENIIMSAVSRGGITKPFEFTWQASTRCLIIILKLD